MPKAAEKMSQDHHVVDTTAVAIPEPHDGMSLDRMFAREVNQTSKIKSLSFKRTLTKQLISVAHVRELLFECTSEMYETTLPTAGRSDKPAAATVIDGIDHESNQEVILVLNVMMKTALERASDTKYTKSIDPQTKQEVVSVTVGHPLKGRFFGFRAGDIKADKRYRVVDVVEVEAHRE